MCKTSPNFHRKEEETLSVTSKQISSQTLGNFNSDIDDEKNVNFCIRLSPSIP